MVAGDHDGTDPRGLCAGDRAGGLRSWRIHDAEQSGEDEIALDLFADVVRPHRTVIRGPEGHRQGSQGAARKIVIGLEDLRPARGGQRPGFVALQLARCSAATTHRVRLW